MKSLGRRVDGGDQKGAWRVGVAEAAARLQGPGQSAVRVSAGGCDCGESVREGHSEFEEEETCWKK